MLIIVLFLITVLVISALAITASMKEQVQRDREDEMIHRGVQYARAIKKYYKKFGAYPATLEALEDTNHVRFLRKKYKDPLTKDGKWVLVRYGQIQMGAQGGMGFTNSGQPGLPNVPGVTGMLQGQNPMQSNTGSFGQSSFGQSSFGQSSFGQSSFGQSSFGQSSFGQNSSFGQSSFGQNQAPSQPVPFSGPGGQAQAQQTTGDSSNPAGTPGATGNNSGANANGQNPQGSSGQSPNGSTGNNLGQTATGLIGTGPMGGGAIIGVASASPKESLRIVNQKNHYKDWVFVYDPMLDRGLIKGPYDPKKLAMGQQQQIGIPAGQAGNSGSSNSTSSFGNSGFGNSSFGNSSFGNSSFGSNNSFSSQGGGFNNNSFGAQQQQQPQPTQPNQP